MSEKLEKAQIMAAINILNDMRFALGRKTNKNNLAIALALAINALYEQLEKMDEEVEE